VTSGADLVGANSDEIVEVTAMSSYVVATVKAWNHEAFRRRSPSRPGAWYLVGDRENLTYERLADLFPRYVFFPHWSWRVPPEIVNSFECVCFHMTDVPFGRGGSPLQNLIVRGFADTKLTALRMVEEWDAGPVYGKRDLSLSGSAKDIFVRAADLTWDLIEEIVQREPCPSPQTGEAVYFRRRTPAMSELPANVSLQSLYDHIRMLDAPTYPRATLQHGRLILEFENAQMEGSDLTAKVRIREDVGRGER
jgi:methionyl-tRNA formyltransferase